MRALTYISGFLLLIAGSCTSTQYASNEYDDLYYSPSDKAVVRVQPYADERIAEQSLSVNDYYDNIYAVDTLVSEQFNDAVQYTDQIIINNYGGGYDYYDYSYSGRINRFYGNYFNPYWRDPFYFSYGYGYPYSGMSFGFGFGYPYFSYGFNYGYPFYPYYNPWYGYGGYHGGYYGGYYSPYYYGGYYSDYGHNNVSYGRRERSSTMSSRANSGLSGGSAYSRRDASATTRAVSSGGARTYDGTKAASSTDVRRSASGTGTGVSRTESSGRTSTQQAIKGESVRTNTSVQQGSSVTRPEYNNSGRTYTPSYNNPRMSTRPSYNNSRTPVSEYGNRVNSGSSVKSVPSTSGGQKQPAYRSGSTGSGSGTYSVPARRSEIGRAHV